MSTPTPSIALVTGGNRGIGRAVVEALAADGIDIVLTYRSHEAEAKQVVDAVAALGRTADAIQLDTTRTGTFPAFVDTLRDSLRRHWERDDLDILVNNAGFALNTVLGSTDEEAIDQMFAVHYKGVYLLTQALAGTPDGTSALLADGGRVVNFSSGLARFVSGPNAVYASMKGAIEVLTRYWAAQLGRRGITVNTLAPGPVLTDFADGFYKNAHEDVREALIATTALGRVAYAGDVGPAVAALVGTGTGWVTAQRIEVSGGYRL